MPDFSFGTQVGKRYVLNNTTGDDHRKPIRDRHPLAGHG
jgi:hypothetical protein